MEPIFNENSWGTDFPDPVSIFSINGTFLSSCFPSNHRYSLGWWLVCLKTLIIFVLFEFDPILQFGVYSSCWICFQIAFHPPVNIDDPEPSYGVFPLPFPMDDHYASDWPEQLCIRRFRYIFFTVFHNIFKHSDLNLRITKEAKISKYLKGSIIIFISDSRTLYQKRWLIQCAWCSLLGMLITLVLIHHYAATTFARIQILLMINAFQLVVSISQYYNTTDTFKALDSGINYCFCFEIPVAHGASTLSLSF